MAITDPLTKKGQYKSAKGFEAAIHWTDIQRQMKKLSFKQFKEVMLPVLNMFRESEK
tara:strand:+ start:4589 stop:4759 length:171 start_codon:yes stop_codon:yes gene_type:complete